jgi:hypothetical protein
MKAFYSITALLISSLALAQAPTTAPTAPERDAETVISVFSDAYEDVAVNTFSADFSDATFSEVTIADNQVLLYESLAFAGIELLGENALDLMAAGITTLHFDYWSPNSVAFSVKLVDFAGDGFTEAPGNDTEATVGRSLPTGEWVSVDLPIGLFIGMNMTDVNQIIISSVPASESTVYLDNIYFYSGGVTIGDTPLDLPVTFEDDDVTYGLSDFAGAVSRIVEDPTDPDNTVVETTKTAGAQTFAGTTLTLDLGGSPNDPGFATAIPFTATATTMQVRVWSPTVGTPVRLKVENSADNTVSVETETNTTVAMMWDTLVFDFTNEATGTATLNLASTYNKASIFFDFGTQPADAATYYWDDVLFGGMSTGGGGGGGGDEVPAVAAPTPDRDAGDVISIYSDTYTDVPLSTLFTTWSEAQQSTVQIEGNSTLRYDNLNFTGIETGADNPLDLSMMDSMHIDIWSANADTFQIKLVDFGGDGFTGGGADPEFEIAFPVTIGSWISLDIALNDFVGVPLTDIQQIIFSARPAGSSTVFVDNIYFYSGEEGGSGGGDMLTEAAPLPFPSPSTVISIYSDSYDDVPVSTLFTEWSMAQQNEVMIDGNATLRYDNLNFTGIETTGENALDLVAAGMTHMRLDYYSVNADTFQVKLVDFGGDGFTGNGGDPEFEVVYEATMGEWVSLDIPLTDFENVPLTDVQQIVLSARPAGGATVYVDNIFFYDATSTATREVETGVLGAFPNPAGISTTITAPREMESLTLFDAAGRVVGQYRPRTERFELPTAELRPGLYVALATTTEGRYAVRLSKR